MKELNNKKGKNMLERIKIKVPTVGSALKKNANEKIKDDEIGYTKDNREILYTKKSVEDLVKKYGIRDPEIISKIIENARNVNNSEEFCVYAEDIEKQICSAINCGKVQRINMDGVYRYLENSGINLHSEQGKELYEKILNISKIKTDNEEECEDCFYFDTSIIMDELSKVILKNFEDGR